MTRCSLGDIVARMKAATPEEIDAVLADQLRMSNDDVLGELLVARGIIDREQLKLALEVQRGLRSKNKKDRALAMARLSKASSAKILEMAGELRKASRRTKRSSTGRDHPAITGALLATKT